MATKEVIGKVTVLNVRASFLSIFEPYCQKDDDGKMTEKWKANFLVQKDAVKETMAKYNGKKMPLLEALRAAKKDVLTKKYGADEKAWPKYKPEKMYWRDGDLENWDGYENCWYISANAQLVDKPLSLTNRKNAEGNWMPAEPGGQGAPYSGCWVNGTIVLWAQDNDHGKRLNAQLKAIQFLRDGEAFGAAPVDPNEEFDDDDVGSEAGEDESFDGDDDASDMV